METLETISPRSLADTLASKNGRKNVLALLREGKELSDAAQDKIVEAYTNLVECSSRAEPELTEHLGDAYLMLKAALSETRRKRFEEIVLEDEDRYFATGLEPRLAL